MSDLPEPFISFLRTRFPRDYKERLVGLETTPPTALRLNKTKGADLDHLPFENKIPWCQNGYWLSSRPRFDRDPLWHAGAYFVQDASSMFIESAWKTMQFPDSDPMVADLCAAPGGKSTHLLDLMDGKGLLLSNEVMPKRLNILQENIVKWGYNNVVISNNSTSDLSTLSGIFDLIVVDAPCSGEGLFCVSESAREQWSTKYNLVCANRQSDILEDATKMLKKGGYLLYSTCTTDPHENEENVLKLLEKNDFTSLEIESRDEGIELITKDNQILGYQCWPHKIKGRAFFMALLQKTTDQNLSVRRQKSRKPILPIKTFPQFIDSAPDYLCVEWPQTELSIIPKKYLNFISELTDKHRIRQIGVRVGSLKNPDRPHPYVAFSHQLITKTPKFELDMEQALAYLSGNAIQVDGDIGWGLVAYQGRTLGWIKNLGKRSNNYYPTKWRKGS
jgi:16S rRNA C967 or C1407 C5-methylase (RsmB/RsmF family)/NOL1/NOP2/fmu family ribosome biogenesis protein